MSGGHYDYAFGRISDLEESISTDIHIHSGEGKFDRYGDPIEPFPPGVLHRMRHLQATLAIASKQAHALEWMMSGDIGFDTFIERYDAAEKA